MLSFLFKKKEEENLRLKEFQKEHQDLIHLYNHILELAKNMNIEELKQKIPFFGDIFLTHIKEEGDEIYKFLESVLDPIKDKGLIDEINKIKKEMIPIRNKVNVLNLKYRNINPENIQDFINDFNYIGELLLNRIELEENKLFKYYTMKKK